VGAKWRFADQGGWLATFPRCRPQASLAQRNGIAIDGPRLLLPLEVATRVERWM
jgi:hypothetical protein